MDDYIKGDKYEADLKEIRDHVATDALWKQESRRNHKELSKSIKDLGLLHERSVAESLRNTQNIKEIIDALSNATLTINELTEATKASVTFTQNIAGAVKTVGYLKVLIPIAMIVALISTDMWAQLMWVIKNHE